MEGHYWDGSKICCTIEKKPFGADVDRSWHTGLSAVVDKSRHLGEGGAVTCSSHRQKLPRQNDSQMVKNIFSTGQKVKKIFSTKRVNSLAILYVSDTANPYFTSAGFLAPSGLRAPHPIPFSLPFPPLYYFFPSCPVTSLLLPFSSLPPVSSRPP